MEGLADISDYAQDFGERLKALGLVCTRDYPMDGPKRRHKILHHLSEMPPSGAEYRECMSALFEAVIKYVEEPANLSQWQGIALEVDCYPESDSTFLMELEIILYKI